MPGNWRTGWWAMVRAEMLIAAAAILLVRQFPGLYAGSAPDFFAGHFYTGHSERHKNKPEPGLLREIGNYCHAGREHFVQSVFRTWRDARLYSADHPLTLLRANKGMANCKFGPLRDGLVTFVSQTRENAFATINPGDRQSYCPMRPVRGPV